MATFNENRINRAAELVRVYDRLPNVETGAPTAQHIADMLADLRHLARACSLDFDNAVSLSEMHFEAEISDGDENAEMAS